MSTLAVDVTKASLQKVKVQFFAKIALLTCSRRDDALLASLTAEYEFGAVKIWPDHLQKFSLRVYYAAAENIRK